MNKLKMKAKAGVTLVELLVVILIVTILSVSLLPLLKPFVVEAQYAAEAIPVIANLRTKIGLYQYEKGPLPSITTKMTGTYDTHIETWGYSTDGTSIDATVGAYHDLYVPGIMLWENDPTLVTEKTPTQFGAGEAKYSFSSLINVDNQDLVGKRCKPAHFQYAVVKNDANYCYVLGCFGDNNGLPKGTGYAVCEINVKVDDKVYKQIGSWKRYKATTDKQITFAVITQGTADDNAKNTTEACPIPDPSLFTNPTDANEAGKLDIVGFLEDYGWEF